MANCDPDLQRRLMGVIDAAAHRLEACAEMTKLDAAEVLVSLDPDASTAVALACDACLDAARAAS